MWQMVLKGLGILSISLKTVSASVPFLECFSFPLAFVCILTPLRHLLRHLSQQQDGRLDWSELGLGDGLPAGYLVQVVEVGLQVLVQQVRHKLVSLRVFLKTHN